LDRQSTYLSRNNRHVPIVLGIMLRIGLATVSTLFVLIAQASSTWGAEACMEQGSNPFSAVSAPGEMLVTWEDICEHDEGIPVRASAQAAIGSTETGFVDMGAISPPNAVSRPSGAFIDDAGDGWVIGITFVASRSGKYESYGEKHTGAWVAFRPAGGSFRAPVALQTGGSLVTKASVAGNSAGVVVLAWSTSRGGYAAWGAPNGSVSSPQFLGRGFQVASVGVDSRGRALIVGSTPTTIGTITGQAGGPFSPIHTIAAQRRNPRKRLIHTLGMPVAAIGPGGNAFIAWETARVGPELEDEELSGPTDLVYRRARGRFSKPVHFGKTFFGAEPQNAVGTVDGYGRTVIIRDIENSDQEVALAPDGHVRAKRLLPHSASPVFTKVTSNAAGQAVIAWAGPCGSCISVVLGDTDGAGTAVQTYQTPHEVSRYEPVIPTIDQQGAATAVWIEATESGEGYAIEARAIAPGATAVQVAESSGF
jgi:hypothetical protein